MTAMSRLPEGRHEDHRAHPEMRLVRLYDSRWSRVWTWRKFQCKPVVCEIGRGLQGASMESSLCCAQPNGVSRIRVRRVNFRWLSIWWNTWRQRSHVLNIVSAPSASEGGELIVGYGLNLSKSW